MSTIESDRRYATRLALVLNEGGNALELWLAVKALVKQQEGEEAD